MIKTWLKIEHHNPTGSSPDWHHSLWKGHPTNFASFASALAVLENSEEFPKIPDGPKYRIVRVTEEVVHETS